ncbi:MAG: DUF2800 domain-containing protein [Clostridiales bacterium]|nr:DUF2800 domain-containing protein [Clostridiales bacterium]
MSTPAAHALLSPSAAHRWLNCTPAPRLESTLPEKTSEYAEEGRLAHSVCELLCRKKFAALKPSTYTAELKRLKKDPYWKDEMLETAAAYVEHLTERYMEFPTAPHVVPEIRVDLTDYVPEAFGTCDCVMIGGDELLITDYKHGQGVAVSAEGNPQMRLYALGALKLYASIYGDSIKRVCFYIDQPRLNSYTGDSMTVEELTTWGEEVVKPIAQMAFAGIGEYTPGEWCKFCRAKSQCRARADSFTVLEDFKDILPPVLSNTEIGNLLRRGKELADWYSNLTEYALIAVLNGEDVPGWKTVEGRSVRQWTDQDKALDALISSGIDRAIVYKTVPETLAALEKAIGKARFEEIAGSFVYKPIGKPTLAPATDKRPAFNSADADFKDMSL